MLETSKTKPQDLESIARHGGTFRRMAARLPTYFTDLRENPAWLPMFLLARTIPFRRAHWLTARRVSKSAPVATSRFGDIEADKVADELRRSGIFTGLILPDPIRQEIARFASETPCFGNFERKLEFRADEHAEAERRFGRAILSGHHFERIASCEAAVAVQQDPLLLNIARHYLGGEAKLITTRTWWSFPTQSASESDLSRASFKFHFDMRGSHNKRRLKHQLTLLVGHPAEEVLEFYGEESAVTLTGKAGYGFVEDPFGFHMGTVAKYHPRLMMEVGFGVSKPSKRRYHGEPVVR
jgi:hypothetical protein